MSYKQTGTMKTMLLILPRSYCVQKALGLGLVLSLLRREDNC